MFDTKLFRNAFKPTDQTQEPHSDFFFAGCDEVGRGTLAGPVVASCVSLHFKTFEEKDIKKLFKEWGVLGITDSKKLTQEKRQQILADLPIDRELSVNQIYTHEYSKNMSLKILTKEISPLEIDQINILNASLKAMRLAAEESCDFFKRGLILIDGNRKFPFGSSSNFYNVQQMTVVEGDSKSLLIGLASIVAKEYRDKLMKKYCEQYPGYHWSSNAGYGTKKHLEAIAKLGITDIHRKTFARVKDYSILTEAKNNGVERAGE